jgi:hypothetical protein
VGLGVLPSRGHHVAAVTVIAWTPGAESEQNRSRANRYPTPHRYDVAGSRQLPIVSWRTRRAAQGAHDGETQTCLPGVDRGACVGVAGCATAPPHRQGCGIPARIAGSGESIRRALSRSCPPVTDLLLVYQAACRTSERFRMFQANHAKGLCNVEAVVLDVRTGIVPFTVTATESSC